MGDSIDAGEEHRNANGDEGRGVVAVVVILVGAPGSGKTTFCNAVMSAARRAWVRVCQVRVFFFFFPPIRILFFRLNTDVLISTRIVDFIHRF